MLGLGDNIGLLFFALHGTAERHGSVDGNDFDVLGVSRERRVGNDVLANGLGDRPVRLVLRLIGWDLRHIAAITHVAPGVIRFDSGGLSGLIVFLLIIFGTAEYQKH